MNNENNVPARPTVTREMVKECALQLCKEHRWQTHCADDIADEYRHHMDSFELCKALDKWCSWDTSREDMEALEGLERLVDTALKKAESEWIEQYQIKPKFPEGAYVECDRGRGHIAGIYSHGPGRYLVKPEGQDDEATGSMRWVILFEDVKLVGGEE